MSPQLHDGIAELLRAQSQVAAAAQLLEAGMTASALRWQLQRHWRYLLPGVVCTDRTPPTPRQRMVAAQLWAGPHAVIGSLTAAAWHGVKAADIEPGVRVVIPATSSRRAQAFVLVERSRRADPGLWLRPPLRLSSPARAVADAARHAAADRARAIVLEAVQRRIVRPEELRHELERGPRPGSAALRQAVNQAEAGAWSVPEADLMPILASSRLLPQAWMNPDLRASDGTRLPRPDAWFDDVALAVQVHSRTYHSSAEDWDATVMSDGIYAEYGVVVVGLTPRRIRDSPRQVLTRIERAYRAAAGRRRPDVIATIDRMMNIAASRAARSPS